jgi:hypothetical protein
MSDLRFGDLPGYDLVGRGLEDFAVGVTSVESLLVAIAAPRLAALHVLERRGAVAEADAELRLYALLGEQGVADPYSRYNALLRQLSSFIHALERRRMGRLASV